MWPLGTWFRDGLGNVWLRVGLNGLKHLFQPKQFYEKEQNCGKGSKLGSTK